MRIVSAAALAVAVVISAVSGSRAAESENSKVIKDFSYEIQAVAYKGTEAVNPFLPMVPLRVAALVEDQGWKVSISGLRLTSVMVGRRKVAVFKEAHGPNYAYILVDGVLRGPDNNAIPGIEGKITPVGDRGEFHVTLKQGIHTLEFDHVIQTLRERSARRAAAEASKSSGETSGTQEGGDSR